MMDAADDTLALEGLLRWYAAMGVDAPVDEEPHDRFEAQAATQPAPRPRGHPASSGSPGPRPASAAELPSASAETLIRDAEARAAAAPDLAALRAALETLPGCTLGTTARMIFSSGTIGSPLMLIGAAPDTDDERHGDAFAGAPGRLLDAMLKAIGLYRASVYTGFVVPWRPPGNRPATPLERALCLPFVRRHIALAAPRAILCFGERAAQPLLATDETISRLRGRWHSYEGEAATIKLLATFSPAYLLSQPLQKRRAWLDLQMVAEALGDVRDR